ncbi:serine/threonine-protein kinase [Dactylosporangium sp. NPDC048998]|uniref:serine/threonine-protein kinase n=1 Tax=Dactylosporangium sp. NPDC048998 TaxID=3363976 RepID=UPI003720FF38
MSGIEVGRRVLDRYLLVRPIARGGMSLVYEAFDLERIRPAAVKVLAPAFASNTRACHAARREPHLMQRMRHPSVPKVFAYGEVEADGVSVPAVAMELLNGVPLASRLAEGPLPWQRAVEIGASIAELLAVAHRRGIAHRDLTADNVMLTTAGVKIIDFGLAVPFAHPAAARIEHAPAWDVYALGVLLYHMLTGRSPHAPGARLLQAAPTPVVLTPGLPRSVAELCRQCMAKRPHERPESGAVALSLWAEFATDWQQPGLLTESYGTPSHHGA